MRGRDALHEYVRAEVENYVSREQLSDAEREAKVNALIDLAYDQILWREVGADIDGKFGPSAYGYVPPCTRCGEPSVLIKSIDAQMQFLCPKCEASA